MARQEVIDTDHLLLAILHDEGDNLARKILEQHNMNYDNVAEVLNNMNLSDDEDEYNDTLEPTGQTTPSKSPQGETATAPPPSHGGEGGGSNPPKTPVIDAFSTDLTKLAKEGKSILFISHKLEEVMELCDNVTVLRHGYCNGTHPISELDAAGISRLMVGRDVVLKIEKEDPKPGKPILEVRNLTRTNAEGKKTLNDVSFTIHEGEVLGIAGVEGNGQSDLSDSISGMVSYDSGTVKLNGKDLKGMKIVDIRSAGMSVIPEDRMTVGCVNDLSVQDNAIADRFDKKENMNGIFLDKKKAKSITDALIKEFEISCDSQDEAIRFLSGGNIQKVVVAREFTSGANFVVANQPTRGVDVGTAEMIRKYLVRQTREKGIGSLLISADLNEILEVSDRLLVMRQGRIVAAFPKANVVDVDELGEYMLGIRTMTAQEMEGVL